MLQKKKVQVVRQVTFLSTNEKRLKDFGRALIPKINQSNATTIGAINQMMTEEADAKLKTKHRNSEAGQTRDDK